LLLELVQGWLQVWGQRRLVCEPLHPLLPVLPHLLDELRAGEEIDDRGRHHLRGEDRRLVADAHPPDGGVLPAVARGPDDEVGGAELLCGAVPGDVGDVT